MLRTLWKPKGRVWTLSTHKNVICSKINENYVAVNKQSNYEENSSHNQHKDFVDEVEIF